MSDRDATSTEHSVLGLSRLLLARSLRVHILFTVRSAVCSAQ